MSSIKYLLQQPKTLESIAMKKIGEWIATLAEKIEPSLTTLEQRHPTEAQELLSRQIDFVRNHVECRLPGRFHDEAMTELKITLSDLLGKVWVVKQTRNTLLRRMIETLFTKNLTSFSCDFFDWEKFGNSFLSESHLIPGLTHLTFHSHYTDDVLKWVEKKFQLIETLDLSNSEINDDCIAILIRLRNLRSVKLSGRGVTERHIGLLLTFCPNIEHIGTKIKIERVIENIVNVENYDGRRFNLKSYKNTCDATFEQQQLVVKMCPSIEKMQLIMYIGEDYENPNKYLNTLRDLQNLRELELFNCEFYTYEIKDLLEVRGNNLVYLCLSQVSEIDFSALKLVSVMCPNLKSLDLIKCEFTDPEDMRQNDLIFCGVEMPLLIHLKKVSVNRAQYFEDAVKRYIIFLLSGCPNIEYINILNMPLRDMNNLMLEVLDKNPTKLKYLRELRTCRELSESVIAQIVENCVNHAEIILCC